MTSAGQLSHRIAFDKRQDIDDGYGNTQSDFVEQFVVWAGVQAKFGGETVTAARLAGQQPLTITVRQSSKTEQVTTDWRARDARSGEIYNIRSIVDPDDSGAYFEMLCQSGVAA
ncbi:MULTISPECIES: phage head closure protein [unclassified Bradyrhizobium]